MKIPRQIRRTAASLVSIVFIASGLRAVRAEPPPTYSPALTKTLAEIDQTIAKGPYKANWESLKAHTDPAWFQNDKFGIYTHWGPVAVGAEDGPDESQWYGGHMYDPQNSLFEYHRAKYGDQNKVGYKEMVAKFAPDKFDAAAWADLFARSGAKFAGPVAIHHDNFAMWNSALTRWNSMNMGPHQDVTGELEKAIRAQGLEFITTFHHGFAWTYFEPSFKFDGADPANADLYTEIHTPGAPPSVHFQDQWLALVYEVLNKYQPDLIWFDFEFFQVITPEYQQKLFAMAYDWAEQHHRTIGVCQKLAAIHDHTGILDFERGREDHLVPYPWLTDTAVGPWFYQKSVKLKTSGELLAVLADIVSKNGCMLLDVSPKADGSIPEEQRQILLEMGDWLKVNGEAIYGTRPWKTYGEGPTKQDKAGGFSESGDRPFTAQDIRFTTKDDELYAIVLAAPRDEVRIKSLSSGNGKISAVSVLGSQSQVDWKQEADALVIQPSPQWPKERAVTFKISLTQ